MAELLNSSIHEMRQFTMCGRFLTPSFSTEFHVWQNLLFKADMFFLAILTAKSCDQFYKGCTQNYKDILGTGFR